MNGKDYNSDDHLINVLLTKLHKEHNFDFRQYRINCLRRRVDVRLRALKIKGYEEYSFYLGENPEEYKKLLEVLTINVTEYFRDKDVWDVIGKEILPDIIEHSKVRGLHGPHIIRAWSAGCSDGAEAYSLAISLSKLLEERFFIDFAVSIFATDIDDKSLQNATMGIYSKNIHLKNIDKNILNEYFVKIDSDKYAISDKLRVCAEFKHHDMILQKPLKTMDLITCRNVLIYFSRELQAQIIEKFHKSLRHGGYLVLGKTESIWGEITKKFSTVDQSNRIYRKI